MANFIYVHPENEEIINFSIADIVLDESKPESAIYELTKRLNRFGALDYSFKLPDQFISRLSDKEITELAGFFLSSKIQKIVLERFFVSLDNRKIIDDFGFEYQYEYVGFSDSYLSFNNGSLGLSMFRVSNSNINNNIFSSQGVLYHGE